MIKKAFELFKEYTDKLGYSYYTLCLYNDNSGSIRDEMCEIHIRFDSLDDLIYKLEEILFGCCVGQVTYR